MGVAALLALVCVTAGSTLALAVWLTRAYGVDRVQPLPLMVRNTTATAPAALAWRSPTADTPPHRVVPARVDPPAAAMEPSRAVSAREIPTEVPAPAARVVVREDRPTFNGRPIRPVRRLSMLVTAYSPDERSCGIHADGITASGYSVWTNGMKLVAADTRLLPFGSIVTIPGYHDGKPVPVLDRGGKIKGHRLDVLYPTHEIALGWGAQRLEVTVWEYAD